MKASGIKRAFIIRAFFLAGATFTSGCMVQPARNQPVEEVDSGVTQAEYDVYSYMLRTIGTARYKFLKDSTLVRKSFAGSICRRPQQSDCVPSSSHTVAAWQDYLRKNERRWPVQPLFAPELGVTMERDAQRPDSTCHSPTVISFSRVGFDRAHTHAIVTMYIRTGKGPFPGCGGSSTMTVVLERERGTWKRTDYIESLET